MSRRAKIRLCKVAGIALCVLFAFLFAKDEVGMSGNESGRFALIQAVGEQGTFHIEKSNFRTVDRVIRNGHVYYDKPPALSWALGTGYRFFHRVFGVNFVDHYYASIFSINFFFGALLNSLLFCWMFDLLRSIRRGTPEWKFLLALASVFSTWLFSYSVMVNNHTVAAVAVLGCFIALRKFERKESVRAALWGGIAAGLAGAVDLSAGAFCALGLLCFSVFGRIRWKFLLISALAGAGILAWLLWLNFHAYGTVMPLYVADGGGTFRVEMEKRDFIVYATDALFGIRGLFGYMPFLLLGVFGFPWRNPRRSDFAAGAVTAGFLLFYLLFTNEYGGYAYGFRYFIPVIALLWFYASRRMLLFSAAWKRAVCSILILWGVATSFIGAYQPFCVSYEGYRSPPGHFTRVIRSSFGGNLLCFLYERHPSSAATEKLIGYYGRRASALYLYYSFYGVKNLEMLARIKADFPELENRR